jgi:DNA-binding transcriptional LysR family regulator
MENWDEVRTAYHVTRAGTVSGAAEALGVHHATVIRHIDALEARLGVKLFQRHARGYTPTEAGEDLARVARVTDDQMAQLSGRLRGRGAEVAGELVITALPVLTDTLMPVFAGFQAAHPGTTLRFLSGERLFRLEYGEAHVAIRAGAEPPDQPDNVVQDFVRMQVGLFASPDYLARFGPLAGDPAAHRFVGPESAQSRAPFHKWLRETVPAEAITFRTDDLRAGESAVRAGVGIGFIDAGRAAQAGLVEMAPRVPDWSARLWLLTHVDLHRTAKVQAFLRHLKAHADAFAQG